MAEDDSRIYGEAELLALLGFDADALPYPFRLTPAGITFEPDTAVWRTLTPEERQEIAPPGWRADWPVLSFPFSPNELARFAEATMLPALMRWRDADGDDALVALESHPKARDLARGIAGVPSSMAVPAQSPGEVIEPDPQRRLRRLRALGGKVRWFRQRWEITGLSLLVKAELSEGRSRTSPKTIRADLHQAAEAERQAERAGVPEPKAVWIPTVKN